MLAMRPDLSRYVPDRVVASAAARGGPPLAPTLDPVHGCALFVDIADFSRLTEQYARAGAEGAERLSQLLDRYFGCMTDIAIAHGGDVIDFMGDAMMVCWDARVRSDEAGMRAVQCGLALRGALREATAGTDADFEHRIGIADGTLSHFEVGGVDGKWLCGTAGRAVSDAAAAYRESIAGGVIVSASMWHALGGACDGYRLPSERACVSRIAGPSPDAGTRWHGHDVASAMLEPYLPEPLLERMRVGGGRWLGEFRNVTTLFIGLPGLELEREGQLERLQRATECVQRVHRQYGGTLTRLTVDDKGVSMLSAFGLPLTAREDDALRAVLAAESLARELAGSGIAVAVGIATGRVLCADSGGAYRRHFALVGAAVNLAARLMVAAPNAILCDEPTRQAAEMGYAFEAQQPVAAKGYDEAIPVWRPRSRLVRRRSRSGGSLVGRESEQRRIGELIAALTHGTAGLVVLRGEAGIGKSSLIAHAASEARARGIRVLSSAGSAIETASAYFPWRQLLGQMLLGDCAFDDVRARSELERLLAGEEQMFSWMPLLNDVLPLGIPDNVITRQMSGEARATSLRALLHFLLTRLAEASPVLIVADDLHWFDGASASALSAVATGVPRVLVLAGTRPLDSGTAREVERLVAERGVQCLDLETLSRDAVVQLVREKMHASDVSDELAAFVFARTAGNPFYVEELALALRSARLIEVTGRRVDFCPGTQTEALEALPDSLRGVIVSRIDALNAVAQLTLKIASVIGREFSLAMVSELYPAGNGAAALPEALQTLLREDVIRAAAPGARGEFAFKHAILQDVIYDQLPFALRRELHLGTARWIERTEAHNLEPHYSELALHWERCEEGGKAVGYLERAAELSLRRYSNRDAIAHVRRAMRLAERHALRVEDERAARWEAILGDAHHELFEYATATRHLRRALALAGRPLPSRAGALAAEVARQLAAQCAARAGALRGAGGEREGLKWASHIYERLAEIAYFDNRPLDLLHATLASLNLAERARSTREIVDGFAALSIGFLEARQRRLSGYYNRRSLEVAERDGTLADVAYAHLVNAVYWAKQGNWAAVESSHARATPLYRELGARARWHQTHAVLYFVYALRGMYPRAAALLAEVKGARDRDIPAQVRCWMQVCELDVALAHGEAPEELITALEEVQTPELHRADRILCQGMIARAKLACGHTADSLAAAAAGLEILAASIPTAWHVTSGLAGIAEGHLAAAESGRDSTLLAKAEQACRLLRRYSITTPISAPRADLLSGRLAWLRGESKRARVLWTRAAHNAASLHLHFDHAEALRELGEHASGDDGAVSLRQAETIFAELDASYALSQVRQALARRSADRAQEAIHTMGALS